MLTRWTALSPLGEVSAARGCVPSTPIALQRSFVTSRYRWTLFQFWREHKGLRWGFNLKLNVMYMYLLQKLFTEVEMAGTVLA